MRVLTNQHRRKPHSIRRIMRLSKGKPLCEKEDHCMHWWDGGICCACGSRLDPNVNRKHVNQRLHE